MPKLTTGQVLFHELAALTSQKSELLSLRADLIDGWPRSNTEIIEILGINGPLLRYLDYELKQDLNCSDLSEIYGVVRSMPRIVLDDDEWQSLCAGDSPALPPGDSTIERMHDLVLRVYRQDGRIMPVDRDDLVRGFQSLRAEYTLNDWGSGTLIKFMEQVERGIMDEGGTA